MNLFKDFHGRVAAAVQSLDAVRATDEKLAFDRISVEPPRDPSHGDVATNAAMVLAKPLGTNPRALAEEIAEALRGDPDLSDVSVAGPGFINMRLASAYWQRLLKDVIEAGTDFGRSSAGGGRKVNVEYVSANPTGPMHVGHCRGAVVGDSLANLLKFAGFDVTKEYYINDAGAQIDVLARSVFLRYREALGDRIGEIPPGLYPGDYLVPVGKELASEFGGKLKGMPEDEWLPIVKDRAIEAMMAMIRDDLAALNVVHDVFFSERSLHAGNGGPIVSAINDLTFKGHVYKGTLPPPKGQPSEDWEDREQTLFRSTEVGDDIDRPLVKSDGSFTYFAADVAYFRDKYARGFKEMIYVLGADHGGYVKRLEAVAQGGIRRRGEADGASLPAREALPRRRTCSHVEAFGRFRHVARGRQRGRTGPGPLHDDLPQGERAARLRLRQGHRAVEGQSGLLRAICACALPIGLPPGARGLPGPGRQTSQICRMP